MGTTKGHVTNGADVLQRPGDLDALHRIAAGLGASLPGLLDATQMLAGRRSESHPVAQERVLRALMAPETRQAMRRRDVRSVFAALLSAGLSQRKLAPVVGMTQSEVSEIMGTKARHVRNVDVLDRICAGLGTPRGWWGLSYDQAGERDALREVWRRVAEGEQRRAIVEAARRVDQTAEELRRYMADLLHALRAGGPSSLTPLEDRVAELGLRVARRIMRAPSDG